MDVASILWPFELGMKCGYLILIIGKHKLLDGMQPDLVSGGMGWAYIGYNPCPWMPPRSDTRDARVATTITIGIDYMHNQNATCTQTFKIGNTSGGQDTVGQQREYGLTVYPVKEGNRSRQHFLLQFCKINYYILVNILGLKFFFFIYLCLFFTIGYFLRFCNTVSNIQRLQKQCEATQIQYNRKYRFLFAIFENFTTLFQILCAFNTEAIKFSAFWRIIYVLNYYIIVSFESSITFSLLSLIFCYFSTLF